MDRDPEEVVDGEKVQDIIVYVNRLGVAKKRVDKRIATLSGEQFDFVRGSWQLCNRKTANEILYSEEINVAAVQLSEAKHQPCQRRWLQSE